MLYDPNSACYSALQVGCQFSDDKQPQVLLRCLFSVALSVMLQFIFCAVLSTTVATLQVDCQLGVVGYARICL